MKFPGPPLTGCKDQFRTFDDLYIRCCMMEDLHDCDALILADDPTHWITIENGCAYGCVSSILSDEYGDVELLYSADLQDQFKETEEFKAGGALFPRKFLFTLCDNYSGPRTAYLIADFIVEEQVALEAFKFRNAFACIGENSLDLLEDSDEDLAE